MGSPIMHAAYIAAMEEAEYRRSTMKPISNEQAPAQSDVDDVPEMPVDDRPLSEIVDELNAGSTGIRFEVFDDTKIAAYMESKPLSIVIPRQVVVDRFVYEREISTRSTVTFPFSASVSVISGLKVYQMYRYAIDGTEGTLYAREVDSIQAHQCYMMSPVDGAVQVDINGKVTLEATTDNIYSTEICDGIYVHAVYAKKRWESVSDRNPAGENADEIGHVYGISGTATDYGIHLGDFVKVGSRVSVSPGRFYVYFVDAPTTSKTTLKIG